MTLKYTKCLLILLFTIVKCFIFASDDIEHCHNHNGTSVIRVYIHLDELAIAAFSAAKPGRDPLSAIMLWFGEIFDEINQDLQPYGVQFHCDFTKLPTTSFPFVYDKTMCYEGNPPGVRGMIADNVFKQQFQGRYGNRIIVFFCPNNPAAMLYGHTHQDACNNTMAFLFGPFIVLKNKILYEVKKAVFGSNEGSNSFNRNVCSVASKCVSKTANIYGQYIYDLKAVRHISSEKYILRDHERLNEHDLYDDIYIKKYNNKLS